MTPYLQQSALQGGVGSACAEHGAPAASMTSLTTLPRSQPVTLYEDSPTAATRHEAAPEFHRSAQLSIPAICGRVGALHIFLDGRTQEDRVRAAVSLDLSGDHHAANARDRELSRGIARRGLSSQEFVPPLPSFSVCTSAPLYPQ